VGDPILVPDQIVMALDFHRKVTDKASAHLKLLGDNTYRTPWLAAKLLSKDKILAQSSAIELATLIASTKPSNRSRFEHHLFDAEGLWANLEAFSQAEPPVLLWHGHGAFAALFKFLAPRFLLAPDHVLDAERVHARWQWSCTMKRSLKMHSLNSCLRLTHYLEHNLSFPSSDELFLNLQAERIEHNLGLEALEEAGDVAPGWRHLKLFICFCCSNAFYYFSKRCFV
jgi:hypothetical protein